MGRYRPPQQPGSKYITREGFCRLQEELDVLWKQERPRVTQAVREAAAQGDRSENADYIYGKKRLREIDRRVRFLRQRLDNITVVDRPPSDQRRIYFGAWVELEDDDGNSLTYRIVGPDEIDPGPGYISMDSPVARALMKKSVDDEVTVNTPRGEVVMYISAVHYRADDHSPPGP
ncbi:MAG: transcription elongation factor GreB [Gammaproteobacteria bacterium]|nr:transcription elongation factor GreB [Gammaproteobacteria bacterium]